MEKKFLSLLLVVAFLMAVVSPAFAGGGKVRGDDGTGEVHQVQVMDPPPFPSED